MGFLSNLFGGGEEEEKRETEKPEAPAAFPELSIGMPLDVIAQEGDILLSGRLTAFTQRELTIKRKPGQLAFNICEPGRTVRIRGYDKGSAMPFDLKGTVAESTRIVFKVKELKVIPYDEHRNDFRLPTNAHVTLYYEDDEHLQNPEQCKLVNLSTGGACVESEYIHGDGEILRLRMQIEDYAPKVYLGQVIRVDEPRPGIFRYGFLFAQLDEQETAALTKMIFNLQVGNKKQWQRVREGPGHW